MPAPPVALLAFPASVKRFAKSYTCSTSTSVCPPILLKIFIIFTALVWVSPASYPSYDHLILNHCLFPGSSPSKPSSILSLEQGVNLKQEFPVLMWRETNKDTSGGV